MLRIFSPQHPYVESLKNTITVICSHSYRRKTMKWYEFADNPQAISVLYTDVPLLEDIEIFQVNMQLHNLLTEITFSLPRYPDNPPRRWHMDCNIVSVTLSFYDIYSTKFMLQNSNMHAKYSITISLSDSSSERKLIRVTTNTATSNDAIEMTFGYFFIQKFEPYIR